MSELLQKIKEKEAKIAVIGLGYVGTPLAEGWVLKGFPVVGYDIIKEKGDKLLKIIEKQNQKHLFTPTDKEQDIYSCDIFIVCVPTPIKEDYSPNLDPILKAIKSIKMGCLINNKVKERLVVITSTVYPGFTRENVFIPFMDKEINIRVAFASEREDPGNPNYNLKNTPKVIGGIGGTANLLAETLFSFICKHTVVVDSTEIAEASKLLENMFRYINISFINEFSTQCDLLGIPPFKVIEAAATKPFGFMKFTPGTGIGGHCIPVDPHYFDYALVRKTEEENEFIKQAKEQDERIKHLNGSTIALFLNIKLKCKLSDSKVLILGVAYKPNIEDVRNTSAELLIKNLKIGGVSVDYYDPFVPYFNVEGITLKSQEKPRYSKYDLVVVHTLHSNFNFDLIEKRARCIYDLTGLAPFDNKKKNVYKNYAGESIISQNKDNKIPKRRKGEYNGKGI